MSLVDWHLKKFLLSPQGALADVHSHVVAPHLSYLNKVTSLLSFIFSTILQYGK